MYIASHFQCKFSQFYNSVTTVKVKLCSLSECKNSKIELFCNSAIKDNDLHCHLVSKNDVFKVVGKLKSDKIIIEGRMLSNNYTHGTNYSYMYLSFFLLFA